MAGELAIVTGAASGIGRAIAGELARRGFGLGLVDRDRVGLERVAGELGGGGAGCDVCMLDLADTAAVEPAVRRMVGEHGTVTVLVNNAGVGMYRPFLEHTAEDHARLMAVNYGAAVAAIRGVLPGMVRRGRGHIINISSMSARMGPWGHAAYAPSKAALRVLSHVLAAEVGPMGVHVSCVTPGIVDTPYFQAGGFAPLFERLRGHAIGAERVARRVGRLLERPRVDVCVPGHYRLLDWISAVSPGLAHAIVARKSRPGKGRECETAWPLAADSIGNREAAGSIPVAEVAGGGSREPGRERQVDPSPGGLQAARHPLPQGERVWGVRRP